MDGSHQTRETIRASPHSCSQVCRLAIAPPSSVDSPKQEGFVPFSMAVLRLLLISSGDVSSILTVLLVLFVLGGGGWGYSRWRA
jgi:hypothetical protein